MIVDTVAGILVRKGKVLVEKRRRDDPSGPGLVVIPGGHARTKESLEDALRREMREELGIRVEEATVVVKRLYTASDGERQRIQYFYVEKWKGRIRAREAERVYWESKLTNLSDPREQKIVANLLQAPSHASKLKAAR
jgi:8-oxo-dGTP diphosphatase